MLSEKFSRSVAKTLGIFYGLGYVGNIVAPLFLTSIAFYWGWRNALFALTVIPATIGLILIFYLRGERVGGKSIADNAGVSLARDLGSFIRNKSALAIIVAQALVVGGTGQGVLVTYTPLFLKNGLGLGTFETSLLYSIAMGGGIAGTVILGRYSDKIGHLKGAVLCTGLSALFVFLIASYSSFETMLVPHLFLVGLLSFPIPSLLQSYLVSVATPSERDILVGLFLTLGFGFSSLWSATLGLLIDTYGSFTPIWLLMSALSTLALFLQLLAYKIR